jgi:hypothetical protein
MLPQTTVRRFRNYVAAPRQATRRVMWSGAPDRQPPAWNVPKRRPFWHIGLRFFRCISRGYTLHFPGGYTPTPPDPPLSRVHVTLVSLRLACLRCRFPRGSLRSLRLACRRFLARTDPLLRLHFAPPGRPSPPHPWRAECPALFTSAASGAITRMLLGGAPLPRHSSSTLPHRL